MIGLQLDNERPIAAGQTEAGLVYCALLLAADVVVRMPRAPSDGPGYASAQTQRAVLLAVAERMNAAPADGQLL